MFTSKFKSTKAHFKLKNEKTGLEYIALCTQIVKSNTAERNCQMEANRMMNIVLETGKMSACWLDIANGCMVVNVVENMNFVAVS